jgi:DNA invertase Pin-like site-specific DNA recombinase
MTSGKRLTERQRDSILRMIAYRAQDGSWLFSYEAVARQLDLDHRTVSECVRRAAEAYGVLTRWHAPGAEENPN